MPVASSGTRLGAPLASYPSLHGRAAPGGIRRYRPGVVRPLDPTDRFDLQRLAAALVLDDDFRPEVAVAKAANLVAKGVDGPATVELAAQPADARRLGRMEIERLFRSMAAEVGVPIAESHEAGWIRVQWIAELMVAGAIPPAVGASRLSTLWRVCGAGAELTWMLQLLDDWEASVGSEQGEVEREMLAYAPTVIAAAQRETSVRTCCHRRAWLLSK